MSHIFPVNLRVLIQGQKPISLYGYCMVQAIIQPAGYPSVLGMTYQGDVFYVLYRREGFIARAGAGVIAQNYMIHLIHEYTHRG
jgi:hypothetical protein